MEQKTQNYDPKEAEPRLQESWEKSGTYKWDSNASREESYVIDTPPPTVSGVLHMGHIFSYTQADFIARFQRMSGKNVFYPMGFDDNGLPTERLVEKVKKIRAGAMPREEFIKICQDVVNEAEEEFRALFRSVALSVDWTQEYQTISEHTRRLSQMSFIDLYNKGEVYRTFEPTLWDPIDRTALAQADVEDKELPGQFHDLTFFIDGVKKSNGFLEEMIIATTRPELLPACVAVFYHPDDERYKHLSGKHALTPLFGVKVPILADEKVSIEKGTGLVMCCTFGDQTDVEWWKKHKLPLRVVLGKDGKIIGEEIEKLVELANTVRDKERVKQFKEKLTGLKVKEAREAIVEALKVYGLVNNIREITHAVKCAERSGAPLEIIVTPQWFVKVLDKKEKLLEKVRQVEWRPDFMRIRAEQWINGLSWDWCISRQRYFGVPFPVWYSKRAGEEGKVLIANTKKLPVNPITDLPEGYSKDEIEPDFDVMDTWATSSISPQISSHGINDTLCLDADRHKKLFPADMRPQAHEIIRTWAFYTLTKAHLHENSVPWKNAMISGWCLASDKTKMSKSKGNVVTPVELIRDKGADSVRYWASTSRLGMDTAFSEDLLKIGKKLVNKLWNATNFASQHFARFEGKPTTAADDVKNGKITEVLDLWILTRLHKTIAKATKDFENYEYCDARVAVEDFFWKDFCDNYLELCKTRSYGEGGFTPAQSQSAIRTLYYCLHAVLKLFAPFVPHVTEQLWMNLGQQGSIHAKGMWPSATEFPLDKNAESVGIACVAVLEAVRKMKSERKVSIKAPLDEVFVYPNILDAKPDGKVEEDEYDEGYTPNKLNPESYALFEKTFDDLRHTVSSDHVRLAKTKHECAVDTDGGEFSVFAAFKPASDAA